MRTLTVVLGVPVDDVTMDETLCRIEDFVEDGRISGHVHRVATVNVDFLVNANSDDHLLVSLRACDLAIPDGMPILWASRWLGSPIRQRVAGADLVPLLAEMSLKRGYRLVFFGAGPSIAEDAAAMLSARFPGADIHGLACPFFDRVEDMSPELLDQLRDLRPDILCVALGNPKQERWISYYAEKLGTPVMIGVGGSLDFIVGSKRRAPEWMQHSGLEWLHRLSTEPRRLWRRYARDLAQFGPLLVRHAWVLRRHRALPFEPIVINTHGPDVVLQLKGSVGTSPEALLRALPLQCRRVIVDMSQVTSIDNHTVAALMALDHDLHRNGGQVVLASLSRAALRSIAGLRLDRSFTLVPDVEAALYELPMARLPRVPSEVPQYVPASIIADHYHE